MSGFFKRFKGGNNEISNKGLKNDTKKETAVSESSCSAVPDNDELSLFSGMTFNTSSNNQQSTIVKTAYQELAESGLNLNSDQPIVPEIDNAESKSPQDKSADKRCDAEGAVDLVKGPSEIVKGSTDIVGGPSDVVRGPTDLVKGPSETVKVLSDAVEGPSDIVESPTDLVKCPTDLVKGPTEIVKVLSDAVEGPSDIVESPTGIVEGAEQSEQSNTLIQHAGKKKKKTQAKRPGYARDSTINSNKENATLEKEDDVKQMPNTEKKAAQLPMDKLATEQLKDNGSDDRDTYCYDGDDDDNNDDDNNNDDNNDDDINDDDNNIDDNNDDNNYHQIDDYGNDGNKDDNIDGDKNETSHDYNKDAGDIDAAVNDIGSSPVCDNSSFEANDNDNAKKERSKEAVHHLYSISTPSSSEDELSGDQRQEQEDSKAKNNENHSIELTNSNSELKDIDINIKSKDNSALTDSYTEYKENRSAYSIQDVQSQTAYEIKVDAEDKLLMMQQDMQFRISALNEEEQSLACLKNYLKDNYSNADATFAERQQELNNLVQEQNHAIANDNYDLAEELAVKIDHIKNDLEASKYKVPALDDKVHEAIQLASDLTSRALAIHRETQTNLQAFKEEHVTQLDSDKDETTTRLSKEKQQLNLEKQRIERTRAHLELDCEHLTKEQTILEEEVKTRTEVFTTSKTELLEKHQQIMNEIKDIEERLAQLQVNQAQIKDEISTEEHKIEEVLKEFLPQRDVLDIQRKDLENQQRLLDEQEELLTTSLEIFNKSIEEWNDKESRLSGLLASLQSAIENNKSVINHLESEQKHYEEFQCIKHLSLTSDPLLENLKTSAKQSHQQIKSLKTKLNRSNLTTASLRKRQSEIEDQISERNEAKNIAKKERNFKEAKRLKEEVEVLTSEGKENQTKLECIVEEHNKTIAELENAEKDFETIADELKQKEYESDIKVINMAVQVVEELTHQVQSYKENDMLHTLITAELQTCQNLIKELCKKHDIDVPLNTERLLPPTDDSYDHPQDSVDDKDSLNILLNELERKLDIVIEIEDFDEAEQIQQQIDDIKCKLK